MVEGAACGVDDREQAHLARHALHHHRRITDARTTTSSGITVMTTKLD
jgi:hypothetical protein